MNETKSIEYIENKIKSLTKIHEESNRTILHLNKIIAGYSEAINIETKKKNDLQKNIMRLKAKLDRLMKLDN